MRQMSRSLGRAVSVNGLLSEGVYAREFLADNELMHCFRSFVCHQTFHIEHVSNRDVLRAYSTSAEEIATITSNVESSSNVVPFAERNLRRMQSFRVPEAT